MTRGEKYHSIGGYERLAAGICQQAFEDLKVAYLLEKGDLVLPRTISGTISTSSLLEKWFKSEDYYFLTGYENGEKIIQEAKTQVQEMRDGIRPMIKSAC